MQTPASFPSNTAWSIVLGARDRKAPDHDEWLARLVATYWKPVCWYLMRRWNLKADDAADLTQEFFLRITASDALQGAAPEHGRFRTFLKLKLRDLVVDDLRRRSAEKRGGAVQIVPLAADAPDPQWGGLAPDEAFDRDWAACLMNEAISQLERQLAVDGKETVYRAFRLCVLTSPPRSYHDCAEALSIKESDVRNYVFRARGELQSILRRLVRESVERDDDLDAECAFLMSLFER